MSSVTPTADSNELSIHNDAVMEQVPSLNQPRPKQESIQNFIGSDVVGGDNSKISNSSNAFSDGGDEGEAESEKMWGKKNVMELDQSDWYGNLPIHHECAKLEYLSEKGRERDSFVSSMQMQTTQPTLSTKERQLESLLKIKELIVQNPESVKQSNQFGFLPLHCALDKTRPNALVVEYLVNAFPDALCVASNEGMKPYDLILKWDHPDEIFWIVLKVNPALDWRYYAELKYGWFLAYFCGTCLVPKMYRKGDDYGEEYYDGRSEQSYGSSSVNLSEARSERKTLANSFSDAVEMGIDAENDGNVNESEGVPFRKISTGDEERGARRISANASLENVQL